MFEVPICSNHAIYTEDRLNVLSDTRAFPDECLVKTFFSCLSLGYRKNSYECLWTFQLRAPLDVARKG